MIVDFPLNNADFSKKGLFVGLVEVCPQSLIKLIFPLGQRRAETTQHFFPEFHVKSRPGAEIFLLSDSYFLYILN